MRRCTGVLVLLYFKSMGQEQKTFITSLILVFLAVFAAARAGIAGRTNISANANTCGIAGAVLVPFGAVSAKDRAN